MAVAPSMPLSEFLRDKLPGFGPVLRAWLSELGRTEGDIDEFLLKPDEIKFEPDSISAEEGVQPMGEISLTFTDGCFTRRRYHLLTYEPDLHQPHGDPIEMARFDELIAAFATQRPIHLWYVERVSETDQRPVHSQLRIDLCYHAVIRAHHGRFILFELRKPSR